MSLDDLDANAREAKTREAEEAAQKVVSWQSLKILDGCLEASVLDLRAIGWGFRSCFVCDMDHQPAWKKLQEGVLHEACIFKEGLLLLANCILCHIQRFFRNYIDLEYPMWVEKIEMVADMAVENGTLCALLAAWYRHLANDVRKRVPDAEAVLDVLRFNTKQYKKNLRVVNLQKHIEDAILVPLMFVPEVGALAAPFAVGGDARAACEYSRSYEGKSKEDIAVCASACMIESLIPVLDRFVHKVTTISEVLLAMAEPLRGIKAEKKMSTAEEFAWKKEVEQYIKDNGLVFDDKIKQEINNEPMHIQKMVLEKGPVKGEEDPAGVLRDRIKTAKVSDFSALTNSMDEREDRTAGKDKKKKVPEEEEVLTPEQELLQAKRFFHHEMMSRQRAHRVSNWCDDLVSLDPLFDYDMEFIPAYKMKEKGYVDQWIDEQKTETGELIADVVRDTTLNAEILLALPR